MHIFSRKSKNCKLALHIGWFQKKNQTLWAHTLRLVAGGTGSEGSGVFVQRKRSVLTMGPGYMSSGGGHCKSGGSAITHTLTLQRSLHRESFLPVQPYECFPEKMRCRDTAALWFRLICCSLLRLYSPPHTHTANFHWMAITASASQVSQRLPSELRTQPKLNWGWTHTFFFTSVQTKTKPRLALLSKSISKCLVMRMFMMKPMKIFMMMNKKHQIRRWSATQTAGESPCLMCNTSISAHF